MTPAKTPDRHRRSVVDDIDEALIGLLQENGRSTYGELARAVGLSEAATRQRVNRLRSEGTLRIVAITDPIALGLRTVAMVGIRVTGDIREAAKRLAELDAIEYVVITSGSFDILVEIVCEDERRLLDIINDQIRAIDGVVRTESFIYLQIDKQVFAWGGRTERAKGRSSAGKRGRRRAQ